jgi:Putative phage tail protein
MAQVTLSLVGGVVGAYYGGPFGAAAGSAIGSVAGGLIDSLWMNPKAQVPSMWDKRVQVSEYGDPIPRAYGDIGMFTGNVFWTSGLQPEKVDVGGIGGGSGFSPSAVTFNYSISVAVIICAGPIKKLLRILADKKTIYDARGINTQPANNRGASFNIYLGTEDQLPNHLLQSHFGVDRTPGFRGTAYVVIGNLQLADFANHCPQFEFEVAAIGDDLTPAFEIPGYGATSQVYDPDRGYLYVYNGGNLTKIDNLGTIVWTAAVPFIAGGLMTIGTDGNVYMPTSGPQEYESVGKFDQDSGAQLGSVGAYSVFDNADHSLIPAPTSMKARNGYLVCGSNAFFSFGLTILDEGDALPPPTNKYSGTLRFVARFGFQSLAHAQYYEGDIDSSGNIWATCTWIVGPTSGFRLHKFQLNDYGNQGGDDEGNGDLGANPLILLEDIDISSVFSIGTFGDGTIHCLFIEALNALLLGYDPADGNGQLALFDLSTETITQGPYTYGFFLGGWSGDWQEGIDENLCLRLHTGPTVTVFDVANWVVLETFDLSSYTPADTYTLINWDESSEGLWVSTFSTNLWKIFPDRVSGKSAALSDIISAELALTGIDPSIVDASDCSGIEVHGFLATRKGNLRSVLDPLLTVFSVDPIETDGKLTFRLRGKNPVRTLTIDSLGAYEGNNRPDPLTREALEPIEIPRRVVVRFINPGRTFQDDAADAKRFLAVVGSTIVHEKDFSFAVSMLSSEAFQLAEKLLLLEWLNGRETFSFQLSIENIDLDPGDNLTIVDANGNSIVMRITEKDDGANYISQCKACLEDISAYVPSTNAVGADGYAGSIDPGLIHPDPLMILMDIPALRDTDNDAGFYIAAGPASLDDSWPGAHILRSDDGGDTFYVVDTVNDQACIGYAKTALASPRSWESWDRINSVTITPTNASDDLVSATELQVLNGANAMYLGGEIIQFATVVDNGDGTFTLSDLIRGRRGTDLAIGTHAVGEKFVLLTPKGLKDREESSSIINVSKLYKAITVGNSEFPAGTVPFTDTGKRLWPYTVQDITSSRDMSGNLTIDWIRRTRIDGEVSWNDGVTEVPLREASESYSIDILDSGVAVRTLSASSPTASYSAADQTTDFGSPQSSIGVVVYQISAVVGRGFPSAATV